MKVLVTGATGFVGGAVARQLAASGHTVRAMARPGAETGLLARDGIEIVRGDLLDATSFAPALRGMDALVHAAAIYSYSARDTRMTYRVNYESVTPLFEAAREAGVRRAVFTSTVATLKWPGAGKLVTEASLATLADLPGHYKRSKLLGEQAALRLNARGFEVVVVNPTAPFGSGDARPTPTGRIVLEFLRRRAPGYVRTGLNVCDVDDVAAGHIAALARGRPGERYILGGPDNLPLREIYRVLGEVTGLRRWPVRIPYAIAFAAGVVDGVIERTLLRREPYIPVEGLRVARHPMYADCAKSREGLGLRARPAALALERAARWYVDNGYAGTEKLRLRGAGK
jgi:dihydroflavonol-4-reductase